MKIIFSPTKSQHTDLDSIKGKKILFPEKTHHLQKLLRALTIDEIKKIFKVSDNIAEKTYRQYQEIEPQHVIALQLFAGTSFKQLESVQHDEKATRYVNDHLVIFSALYGVLEPFISIFPYRLDMYDRVLSEDLKYKDLYEFWRTEMERYFKNEELIINLASKEYSAMVPNSWQGDMITVHFIIVNGDIEKVLSMDVKKQRGKLLNYMIKNQILDIKKLYKYSSDGYVYDAKKSDIQNMYFIKNP